MLSEEQTVSPKSVLPDLQELKTHQQAACTSGNYAIIGTSLQIVGESLCEAVDVSAADLVLDVAAGNGNATLAAARRWCHVTSTDYVPTLLDKGRARATAEGLEITFLTADAEALPFGEATFDVVLSTFGVMFTPNQELAAQEMIRVCKVFTDIQYLYQVQFPSIHILVMLTRSLTDISCALSTPQEKELNIDKNLSTNASDDAVVVYLDKQAHQVAFDRGRVAALGSYSQPENPYDRDKEPRRYEAWISGFMSASSSLTLLEQ